MDLVLNISFTFYENATKQIIFIIFFSAKCIFQFSSQQHENGNFSSPQYPKKYSEELRCIYNFHGKDHETLRLTFYVFDLEAASEKG